MSDLYFHAQVCPLCAVFTSPDGEALQRHVELCAARVAAGGAAEGLPPGEEQAYQRFLALRGLPVVQSGVLLMVLNSLGTAVRLGLPLLDARFARVRSRGLAALPVLHALDGQPPLLPSDLPEDVLRRFAALLFPPIAFVRLPAHAAFFYVTTSPAWRPWYLRHHEWLWPAILLVETLVAGFYMEAVNWGLLRRVVVWPAAMLLTGLVGDLIGHRIWVRVCLRRAPRVGSNTAARWWRCHSASTHAASDVPSSPLHSSSCEWSPTSSSSPCAPRHSAPCGPRCRGRRCCRGTRGTTGCSWPATCS